MTPATPGPPRPPGTPEPNGPNGPHRPSGPSEANRPSGPSGPSEPNGPIGPSGPSRPTRPANAARGATLTDLARRAGAASRARAYGDDALIVCDRLVRIFSTEGVEVQALQGLDLLVRQGELTALVGASGSGKSTLLNILAGLDAPSAGSATVAGYDLMAMNAASRLRYRRETVGFIWQRTAHNLLPYLTATQNVTLPMSLSGRATRRTSERTNGRGGRRRRTERARELLDLLGMADNGDRHPAQLSGGEQQRVAIAVALANTPSVVLADEPTGELDTTTASHVFTALRRANAELGTTILVVTHDKSVSSQVSRTISIRDGRTSTETLRRPAPAPGPGPEAGTRSGNSGIEGAEENRGEGTGEESRVAGVGGVGEEAGEDSGRGGGGGHVPTTVSREYTTIDRSGRLQLPREFTDPLAIRDRVLLELRPDHIEIHPSHDDEDGTPGHT